MLRRIGAAVFGFALVGLVIGSGYWATFGGATAVVVFGLASALVAPLGLSALGYAAGLGQEGLITRLARVPEIERLAARAETEAERLALLQKERADLAKIIEQEVRRGVLVEQHKQLETQGRGLLASLQAVDQELSSFPVEDSTLASSEAISNLRARLDARRRGDIVISIGGYNLVIDATVLGSLPLGGIVTGYLRFVSQLLGSRPSL